MPYAAAVITVSDRSSRGEREDLSGPIAVAALHEAGFVCDEPIVIPDGADEVEAAIRAALTDGIRVIVTTGGTGVGPRDETPEGADRLITRRIPGIAEELRRRATAEKPAGMLSRGIAGIAEGAFVVNLPGAPAAVEAGMPVIVGVAAHVLGQLQGADHRHAGHHEDETR
ncbi:MogA/MoaB family molybdenum cofactor biosynthesis protein [Microbacterium horticulturae]|uniref:MogA/MoaB family molybdenum cofactor biosynthesis protein n=1 Tax=Microbacterium horticulturae TaxID=3028316 RepID=A0ABY8BZW9_9MICO|nr:MogA/MoaB family molybdenum cofactor biosynthesis protein [Microbacterium sp. KACC 23027]WEG09728.1 MogA/MoaB family molybdenum cofactor biosynthesis protein [Microbacterium sp. KACC 23027]